MLITGQPITEAVIEALREQLHRETGKRSVRRLEEDLRAISRRCSRLPDQDTCRPEDIIGFDEHSGIELLRLLRPCSIPNIRRGAAFQGPGLRADQRLEIFIENAVELRWVLHADLVARLLAAMLREHQIMRGGVHGNRHVEKPDHHLFPGLLAVVNFLAGVRIEAIVR